MADPTERETQATRTSFGYGRDGGPSLHDDLLALITMLLAERAMPGGSMLVRPSRSSTTAELWRVFRGLVNTREPWLADPGFLEVQDRVLQALISGEARIEGAPDVSDDGVTTVLAPSDDDAEPGRQGVVRSYGGVRAVEAAPIDPHGRVGLWRGDITRLAVDAIVNAANARLLGCWQPNHLCIDNAIHTFAGVQLRIACAEMVANLRREFGADYEEPTARARVTDAFNLPSRRVIHTVGPIVADGRPTTAQREQLAQCYRACLDAAADEGARTVALCAVSTGVFGFPVEQAAPIAVQTVRDWLDQSGERGAGVGVVFDVFSIRDEVIYRDARGM